MTPPPSPVPAHWPRTSELERRVGALVWITAPNPLVVYVATLYWRDGEFVQRIEATGSSETAARDRLEALIGVVGDA
jgi:hypothetical protein